MVIKSDKLTTTICISLSTKEFLDSHKIHRRESYDDCLERILYSIFPKESPK